MTEITKKKLLVIACTLSLAATPLALVGCGGSSGTSAQTHVSQGSDAAKSAGKDAGKDTDKGSEDTDAKSDKGFMTKDEIEEAWAGQSSDGVYSIYYFGNAGDKGPTKGGLVLLSNDGTQTTSFLGKIEPLSFDDGTSGFKITDKNTGETLTFSATEGEGGTLILDMGQTGSATVGQADKDKIVEVITYVLANTPAAT